MKYVILFLAILFSCSLQAQKSIPLLPSSPQYIVVDGGNDCIRKLSADGMVTTFAKK